MPLLKRRRVLAAKVETTIGTPIALAGADGAFNAYDVIIQPSITIERREAQGSFNRLAGVPGAQMGRATFKTDLGWDGTATVPTWASVFLPACGFVNATGVFTPRSEGPGSNVKTLTIGCYLDGKFKSIAGAMGTFKINLPAGRMAFIEWDFSGVWQEPSDVALIAPTYPDALPIRFADATVQYDAVDLVVENVTVDAGNNVIMRESAGTLAGYISALVTDREPKITANPEAVTVATQDRYGAWVDSTEAAFTVALNGPTTSTLTISAPAAQILNVQEADREGLVTDEIEWGCNKNGADADEELSLTFTAAA